MSSPSRRDKRSREDNRDYRRRSPSDEKRRRPHSRERRKPRSRSRSRDKRRSRSRSQDRHRGHRDRRDRSRSSERNRRRSRSRSRDRNYRDHRNRSRSNERNKKRPRSPHKRHSSNSRETKKREKKSPSPASGPPPAHRFCDVFASKSKFREEWIRECFNPELQLSTFEGTLLQEKEPLLKQICSSEPHSCENQKQYACASLLSSHHRVFISAPESAYTFALHFNATPPSFGESEFANSPCLILYRATKNQIDRAWICLDKTNLGSNGTLDATQLQETPIWALLLPFVKDVLKGEVEFHYNNYAVAEDLMGAGLGTTSKQESWTINSE